MDCPDCTKAAARRWHGFSGGCRGCCARAAARSPQFRKVRDSGDEWDRTYRNLLERFRLTHEEVRAAHQADFAERGNA